MIASRTQSFGKPVGPISLSEPDSGGARGAQSFVLFVPMPRRPMWTDE